MRQLVFAPKQFFIFLVVLSIFSSLSFSSLLWTSQTNGPVTVQPISVGSEILFASHDGSIYLISQNGAPIWKRSIGKYILQPITFNENIVALTTSGHFVELSKGGGILRDLQLNDSNLSYFYGMAADLNKVYITTNGGLIGINKTGTQYLIYKIQKNTINILTAPTVTADSTVLFGVDDELFAIKNGVLKWKTKIDTVWKSRPVVSGNTVYIGTLSNKFYAIDIETGALRWKKEMDGWIIGTPTISGQTMYVGTTHGYFYAFDIVTGGVLWQKKTTGGIWSTASAGTLIDKPIVLIGSDDSNLYVFDAVSGKLFWKWATGAKAGSPLFHYGKIVVPSYDGNVYGLSTNKMCIITTPEDGSTIGSKEVLLKGSVLSEGDNTVYVRIEDGEWKQTFSEDAESWSFVLDPTPLSNGMNLIECKVGTEDDEPSSGYFLNYDKSIPLGRFSLEYPVSIEPGKEFLLSIKDADNPNIPINGFTIIYEGKTTKTNVSNVTLKLSQPGKTKITLKKIGFQDGEANIEVKGGVDVVAIAGVLLVVLALLYFYFFIYKRR